MPTGQLESFVVEKGFGFIVPDTGKGKVYAQIGQFKGGEEDIAKLVTGGGGQLISYVLDPEKKMVKTALQWNLKGDADPEPEPNINKGDGRGATGRMKNFEPSKGFGFIVPDGGGENVFCHARQFDGADVDDIQRDDRVCYDTEYDEKKGKTKASRWCREEGRQQSRDAGKGGRNGDRRGRSRSRSRGYRPAYGAPPAYGHPGMPHPGYGMPPPGYGMPPPGYGMPHQPPPGYGGPPPAGYGAPPGMYGPAPGGKGGPYGAPSPYGAPPAAYGAQPPHGYGGPPGPYGAPPAAARAAPAPAQQSPPLPADWEQIHDPSSGKPYYHNRVTHETSWTLPAVPVGNSWALPAAAAAAAAAAPTATPAARPSMPLPDGFEQHTDPSSGKPYFVNKKTGETSWTPPVAAGGEAPPAAREAPPSKGDWDQMTDPASGKPYYVNRSTRETSWTIPAGAGEGAPVAAAQPVAAATKEHASSSPADWEELKDPASGRFYYRHRKTGETSWTPSSSSPREA